jgi:hypothetical protein
VRYPVAKGKQEKKNISILQESGDFYLALTKNSKVKQQASVEL